MSLKRGFTLIELMIVVAIVAILAALAVPAYQRYVFRARRADGQNLLLALANSEERYYATYNKYTKDATLMGYAATPVSEKGYYTVALAVTAIGGPAQGFTATATPQPPQASDVCGPLSIDNTGNKQPDINSPLNTNGKCW